MASEEWDIDLKDQRISHKTIAFSIQFDGDPTTNECEGKPSRFPEELTSLQKVRLLREAYDAYIEAYEIAKPQRRNFGYSAKPSGAPERAPKPAEPTTPDIVSNKPTLRLKKP